MPELGSRAVEGCVPSEGLQAEGFGFIGMGVPHSGEEMHTRFWLLGSPTHRARAKNKTGLTESKLIQHEEALKKIKIIFDT